MCCRSMCAFIPHDLCRKTQSVYGGEEATRRANPLWSFLFCPWSGTRSNPHLIHFLEKWWQKASDGWRSVGNYHKLGRSTRKSVGQMVWRMVLSRLSQIWLPRQQGVYGGVLRGKFQMKAWEDNWIVWCRATSSWFRTLIYLLSFRLIVCTVDECCRLLCLCGKISEIIVGEYSINARSVLC